MAMYSRSPCSIIQHIEKVNTSGSGNFLEKYYIGYGDDSIGDCVNSQLYVENISMIAAKNIQNHSLYNGQEASTRYLDFSIAEFIVSSADDRALNYVEELRTFYKDAMPIVVATYASANDVDMTPISVPLKERTEEQEKLIAAQTAIKAKAFDVLRGFLPYGACTNVAITMNVRVLREHCWNLRASRIPEVALLGQTMLNALAQRYEHSFGREERPQAVEERRVQLDEIASLEQQHLDEFILAGGEMQVAHSAYDPSFHLESIKDSRSCGLNIGFRPFADMLYAQFPIDIGSYRDLQRHRSCIKNFPLATTKLGYEPWYLAQLPEELVERARDLLEKAKIIASLYDNPQEAQYVIPMAYRVNLTMTGSVVDFDYITHLRSGPTVHPTVRTAIQKLVVKAAEKGVVLRCNMDPAPKFYVRRGQQTIHEK
jgi:thymidylate synthase ThyX